MGIDVGKDIKVVELSYIESNFVTNCYVFFEIFIFFIVSVDLDNSLDTFISVNELLSK